MVGHRPLEASILVRIQAPQFWMGEKLSGVEFSLLGKFMNKRVFIIHGWDGYPEEGWFLLFVNVFWAYLTTFVR